MHGEVITAVDFGSKKLSASMGLIGKEELEIYGTSSSESLGIKKGFITNEVKCTESLKKVLEELSISTGKKVSSIFVGISTRGLRMDEVSASVNLNEGKATQNLIHKAIEKCRRSVDLAEKEEVVDIIINYFILDGKIIEGNITNWRGSILEVNVSVIIGPREELEKFKNVVKYAGYNFEGFMVNVISGKKAFLEGKNASDTRVLVDVGAGTTDVAIFNNGLVKYIGNIPVGGKNITNDLSICAKMSLSEAENIKLISSSNYETLYKDEELSPEVEIGTKSISRKLLHDVIKARIEEILKVTNIELKNSSYFQGFCSIIFYGDGLSYFENINSLVNAELSNKAKIITNRTLGMKNSSNLTSLVILKDVFDRVNILSDNNEADKIKEIEKNVELKKINERNLSKETNDGIINKIRGFLREHF